MPNTQQPGSTRDMPLQTRAAPIQSVNPETRTATLCWSKGASVRRYDWHYERYYLEELSMEPEHIRLDRLRDLPPITSLPCICVQAVSTGYDQARACMSWGRDSGPRCSAVHAVQCHSMHWWCCGVVDSLWTQVVPRLSVCCVQRKKARIRPHPLQLLQKRPRRPC